MEKKDYINHTIRAFDNYLNDRDKCNISSVTERLRETLRFKYPNFNTSSTLDFVKMFSEQTIRELFGECDDFSDEVMNLTILDKKWRFNKKVISALYGNYEFEELKRAELFSDLMSIISELSNYTRGKENYGQKLYNLIRMEFLIRKPITTRMEYEKAIDKALRLIKADDKKVKYFKVKLKSLFDSFYIEIEENTDLLYVCKKCGYLKDRYMSDKYHYFCDDEIVVKFTDKHKGVAKRYVVKKDVYQYYTQPGLLEKDIYDMLKKAGFKVKLYPGIEKYGDVEVILDDKSYYIDAKTTRKINTEDLAKELEKNKYKDRFILLPDKRYEIIEDYLLADNPNLKIFNKESLISYLIGMREGK